MTKKLAVAAFVAVILSFLVPYVRAQDADPAFRFSTFSGLARSGSDSMFTVGGGIERFTVRNLSAGIAFRYAGSPLGESSIATIELTSRYYFNRGGRFEAFAMGEFSNGISAPNSWAAGGGVDLYVIPKAPNLGLRIEVRDEVDLSKELGRGGHFAGVRAGLTYRF